MASLIKDFPYQRLPLWLSWFACNARNLGSIARLERSPGEGKGYPLQYSGLENSMDCIVHGVAKSRTHLSDFHFSSLYCIIITLYWLWSLSRRSPGEGNGNPLQYSCLENLMDRGAWKAPVHRVTKSHRQLSTPIDRHPLYHDHHLFYLHARTHKPAEYIWASQISLVVKNLLANAGDSRDAGLPPGLRRSPRAGLVKPIQYSCLENRRDRGAWWATVHRVTNSQTRVNQLSLA